MAGAPPRIAPGLNFLPENFLRFTSNAKRSWMKVISSRPAALRPESIWRSIFWNSGLGPKRESGRPKDLKGPGSSLVVLYSLLDVLQKRVTHCLLPRRIL